MPLTEDQYKILYAFAEALRRNELPALFQQLVLLRQNRAANEQLSPAEFPVALNAETLDGNSPESFAPADHTHPQYYRKDEPVNLAYKLVVDGVPRSPTELAPAEHEHDEYIRIDERPIIAAKALNGIPAEQFLPADHNHDGEYVRKDEFVYGAFVIGGKTASDFAPLSHTHSNQYYLANEPVDNAFALVQDGRHYTDADFAPADHDHDDRYYTPEEFKRTFLLKGEGAWAAKKIKTDVYNVSISGATLDTANASSGYELLQSPFIKKGMRPEARLVGATLVKENTTPYDASIEIYTGVGVARGRYVSFTTGFSEILGVFTMPRSNVNASLPVQVPTVVAWNGNTFYVYAMPYIGGASSIIVDILVIGVK